MRQTYQHRVFAIPLYLSAFLVFVLLVFSAPLCHAEVGFDIKELNLVASRNKPKHGERQWFRLPGTNIKAGAFHYTFESHPSKGGGPTITRISIHNGVKITEYSDGTIDYALADPPDKPKDKPEEEEEQTIKAALLVNKSVVYFVHSVKGDENKDFGNFDVGGDCNFGTYRHYFLMDCPNVYASGNNRRMFLFRYGKNKVELLDVIVEASLPSGLLDFMSAPSFIFPPESVRMRDDYVRPIVLIQGKDFSDIDNDNRPEVIIEVSRAEKFTREFDIYLEIKDDRLRVDFNPNLYKPIFEREKKLSRAKKKSNAYYISGFLAGKLTMEHIKTRLAADREQYDRVVPLLEGMGNLDAAFHEYDDSGGRPVLKRYEIKWR